MKKRGRRILQILILIILFLFSFAVVYPLIFLLGGSLKSTPELGNNLAALWSADGTLHWTWLPFERPCSIMWNCFSMSRAIMSCSGIP